MGINIDKYLYEHKIFFIMTYLL